MVKSLILSIVGVSISFLLSAQVNDTAYINTFGGLQNESCSQIQPTWDTGYVMLGTTNSFGCGNTDMYLVKTDSLCHKVWSKSIGGPLNDEGFSVTPTYDHGFALLGFTDSYGNGGYDAFLVKTDSAGNIEWKKTYGGTDWDFGYSVKQTIDSGFIICGLTYSYGAGNGDVFVVKTDKKGDTIWTRTVGGTGYDIGNSVFVQEDSLYVIAGETTSIGTGDTDSYFIEINNKGTIERTRTYGITQNDALNSIRGTADKGFIMYGSTDSIQTGKPDELLIKTDSVGVVQWMQVYHSGGIGIGKDALQLPDGNYLAVSTSNAYGFGGFAMRLWEVNSGGWPISGPSLGGAEDEFANSVALSVNGSAAFAGVSSSTGTTSGLFDIYAVHIQKDTILNSYGGIQKIYNYKDTCNCTPASVLTQAPVKPGIKMFPNPVTSSSVILIQGGIGERYEFKVYNEVGQCIIKRGAFQSALHGQYAAHIEKTDFISGVYIFEIFNQDNIKVGTGKFIVE